jgi:predicted phage terminase large subunit-like protein
MQASIKNFEASWIQRYENMSFTNMNKYILVDPASKKTKSSDYTVILVMGLNEDGRYYLIDGVRDRLGLSEKWDRLYSLVKRHKPLHVGYEEYGMVADIEYLRMKMEEVNYRFQVVKLGKKIKKEERILALQPLFKESKIWLPQKILFQDYEGRSRDLVREFIEDEYMFFPYCSHDDMLDCMARIVDIDMGAVFPETQEIDVKEFFCKDEYKYY